MADDSSFEQKTAAFLAWFTSQPGTTFHKDIEIRDLRVQGAGRGIIATADIPPETTLFTIPRTSIISAETSPLTKLLPTIFNHTSSFSTSTQPQDQDQDHTMSDAASPSSSPDDEAASDDLTSTQDSWTTLILILLHQHLLGSASPWHPYLDILPSGASAFTTPMFWTADELAALQASPVAGKVGREEAEEMIRTRIIPIIRAHEDVFFPAQQGNGAGPRVGQPLSDDELLELGFRMGSIIMAYAFDLEKEDDDDDDENQPSSKKANNNAHGNGFDGDSDDDGDDDDSWIEDREGRTLLGMVPMADLLNADASFNAHIEHGEHALVATSLRTIHRGEEILNYYGPLSNGELLRRYGYVTPRHRRWNLVDISWAAVRSALHAQVDVKGAGLAKGLSEEEWDSAMGLLEDEEMEEDFVVERGATDPDSEGRVDDECEDDSSKNGNGEKKDQEQQKNNKKKAGVPEELIAQLKEVLKAVKKVKPAAVPDKITRDRIIYSCIAVALEDRMRQYGTTLEHDLAEYERASKLVAAAEGGVGSVSTADGRKLMALDVRIGEKVLLKQASDAARARLAELDEAARDGEGRSAKRRRV